MIEINNLTSFAVDKKFLKGVAKKVLKGENEEIKNLSVAFVGPKEMQKLNKRYRKEDKPTDVLSFGKNPNPEDDFSEIIICPQIVKKNILGHKSTFKQELAKVLIHGILHVLGYNHEKSAREELIMVKKEKSYFEKISN